MHAAVKAGLAVAVVATAAAALWVYGRYDPEQYYYPRCVFNMLTGGLKCPGCGSQRAVHALLNGHIAAAFRHNALMVAALPVLAGICLGKMPKIRGLKAVADSPAVAWGAVAAVTGFWILRNIFGW